jgi:hypothetical protein
MTSQPHNSLNLPAHALASPEMVVTGLGHLRMNLKLGS